MQRYSLGLRHESKIRSVFVKCSSKSRSQAFRKRSGEAQSTPMSHSTIPSLSVAVARLPGSGESAGTVQKPQRFGQRQDLHKHRLQLLQKAFAAECGSDLPTAYTRKIHGSVSCCTPGDLNGSDSVIFNSFIVCWEENGRKN